MACADALLTIRYQGVFQNIDAVFPYRDSHYEIRLFHDNLILILLTPIAGKTVLFIEFSDAQLPSWWPKCGLKPQGLFNSSRPRHMCVADADPFISPTAPWGGQENNTKPWWSIHYTCTRINASRINPLYDVKSYKYEKSQHRVCWCSGTDKCHSICWHSFDRYHS